MQLRLYEIPIVVMSSLMEKVIEIFIGFLHRKLAYGDP
jgi:hypothetical protein